MYCCPGYQDLTIDVCVCVCVYYKMANFRHMLHLQQDPLVYFFATYVADLKTSSSWSIRGCYLVHFIVLWKAEIWVVARWPKY